MQEWGKRGGRPKNRLGNYDLLAVAEYIERKCQSKHMVDIESAARGDFIAMCSPFSLCARVLTHYT